MQTAAVVANLKNEWRVDEGFFALIGEGFFDENGAERVRKILNAVHLEDGPLDREVVKHLWVIPIFMLNVREKVKNNIEDNIKTYDKFLREFHTTIENLLGQPELIERDQ